MFYSVTARTKQLEFLLIVRTLVLRDDKTWPKPFEVETTKHPEIEPLGVNGEYSDVRRASCPPQDVGQCVYLDFKSAGGR